jgi:hypothetical protein
VSIRLTTPPDFGRGGVRHFCALTV